MWKIIHPILNPSDKTLKTDTKKLNKYFNETKSRRIETNTYIKDELKNLIECFPEKNNGFHLHAVSYEDVARSLKLL